MTNAGFQSLRILALLLFAPTLALSFGQNVGQREWKDATGKFKIVGTLVEVKGSDVYLKTADGKTMRIPVAKLSQADQQFLSVDDSPFEVIGDAASDRATMKTNETPAPAPAAQATTGGYEWTQPLVIDWDSVSEMDSGFGAAWSPRLPESNELPSALKRVSFTKKMHFFENMHEVHVNPLCNKAAIGCTVSFSVPKPLTRVSIADYVSGKSMNSLQIEASMRPLTVLNDGSTLLMVGNGKDSDAFEKSSELQLWIISGKKIFRSAPWQPFSDEEASKITQAIALPNDLVALRNEKGHLAVINIKTREAVWHARLTENSAIDASTDRTLLAILSGDNVFVVDAATGAGSGSVSLDKDHIAWPRVRWSPDGKKLLVAYTNSLRLLNLENGQWEIKTTLPGNSLPAQGLEYPHQDYALLGNRVLIHLPSEIQVCDYLDVTQLTILGGKTFVSMMSEAGGIFVPSNLPHPAAEQVLQQAVNDPSVFLIHPDVEVSINAAGAGQYQSEVRRALEDAATKAGYKVVANAPISIVANISGPTREAVSYIARGSYTMDKYTSSVRVVWEGKDVWSTSTTNVQGFIMTKPGQSFEDAVNEAGKKPNLGLFEAPNFPKLLQRPRQQNADQPASTALLVSKFTMQGLVDNK